MDSPAPPRTVPEMNAQPTSNTDSASTPIQQLQVNAKKGARVFHVFPALPLEIRRKIWGYAASVQRVIELDNLWKSKNVLRVLRPYVRVAPNSRIPPAILHVNRESRSESLRYYQLTNFEVKKPASWGPNSEHYIYYNPGADIVYFGTHSSLVTLIAVLRKGLEIPNLAVVYSSDWVDKSMLPAPHLKLLQILHGIDQHIVRSKRWLQALWLETPLVGGLNHWPGCNGLKTLLLVLPAGSNRSPGGNSKSVHFQTATDAALADHVTQEGDAGTLTVTGAQSTVIVGLQQLLPTTSEVTNFNQGVELKTISENRWGGDERPRISFASIGQGPLTGKVQHSIFIDSTVMNNKILNHDSHALTRNIAAQTGCSIEIGSEPGFVPPEYDELGQLVVSAAALTPLERSRSMVPGGRFALRKSNSASTFERLRHFTIEARLFARSSGVRYQEALQIEDVP